MERRIFAVLVLMAAVAAYGSDSSVRLKGFDAQHFAGPMCFPGDPCGWPGIIQGPLNGPVCYPGDPCGPWPGAPVAVQRDAGNVEQFNGPMCMPGDPCGSGTTAVESRINFGGPMCFPGDPCGPGIRVGWPQDASGIEMPIGPVCF